MQVFWLNFGFHPQNGLTEMRDFDPQHVAHPLLLQMCSRIREREGEEEGEGGEQERGGKSVRKRDRQTEEDKEIQEIK